MAADLALFSCKQYDAKFFAETNEEGYGLKLKFFDVRLTPDTTALAAGQAKAVCCFVNDNVSAEVLEKLAAAGIKMVAMRCAGYNNVDLEAAKRLGVTVARVPAYSPYAVAEHAVALMLSLNRKTHRSYVRGREGNFELAGLCGFDMEGKRVGVVGTGLIGALAATIVKGFGCELLAYDVVQNQQVVALGAKYVTLDELFASCDIITIHCPLLPSTRHLVNADRIARMKRGAMLINTARGGVMDAQAVLEGLKSGQIGALGCDVYENEAKLFFEDKYDSDDYLSDDVLTRLLSFPNVLLTAHQAFFTKEAMAQIAATSLGNVRAFLAQEPLLPANVVVPPPTPGPPAA